MLKRSPEEIYKQLKKAKACAFPFDEIALEEVLRKEPAEVCQLVCEEIDKILMTSYRGGLSRLLGFARIKNGLWLYQLPYYDKVCACTNVALSRSYALKMLEQLKNEIRSSFDETQ